MSYCYNCWFYCFASRTFNNTERCVYYNFRDIHSFLSVDDNIRSYCSRKENSNMKVIYTLINRDTWDCYVGQTNSLARRLVEHAANGLFLALQIPTTMPLFVSVNTWVLIIKTFFTNDANGDERKTWEKMLWLWYNMHNKTFR